MATADAQQLALQLRLAEVAELARRGQLNEAQARLAHVGPDSDSIAELDLLARIYAQQNRYSEAAALWSRVLSLDPNHEAAKASSRDKALACAQKSADAGSKPIRQPRSFLRTVLG